MVRFVYSINDEDLEIMFSLKPCITEVKMVVLALITKGRKLEALSS